jgi:hypothetical protein
MGSSYFDWQGSLPMASRITLELETPGDSRTMFRVYVDDDLVGESLTAVQAHILVGRALDRISLPQVRRAGITQPTGEQSNTNGTNNDQLVDSHEDVGK